MDKQMVQVAIEKLLNSIGKEEETYTEALSKNEIFEIRKAIRLRIRELNQRLVALYKSLEELENEY